MTRQAAGPKAWSLRGMQLCFGMALVKALLAGPLFAQAPQASHLPIPRPAAPSVDVQAEPAPPRVDVRFDARLRPIPRPAQAPDSPNSALLGNEALAAAALAAVSGPNTHVPTAAPAEFAPDAPDAPRQQAELAPRTDGTLVVSASAQVAPEPASIEVGYNAALRPIPRPTRAAIRPATVPLEPLGSVDPAKTPLASAPPVFRTHVPVKRPNGLRGPAGAVVLEAAATARTKPSTTPVRPGREGRVCSDRRVRGRTMSPIKGRISGCGISAPVLVSEVSGIPLTRPATLHCSAAIALADWVDTGVKPAVGRYGGGLANINVVASYSCRTRNNKKGAKLSEHAKGHAVDVASVTLKNGDTLDVLRDWRQRRTGAILKQMHKAACGPFGTVLGPNADRYHQNHFHMDVASYRSGPYCR